MRYGRRRLRRLPGGGESRLSGEFCPNDMPIFLYSCPESHPKPFHISYFPFFRMILTQQTRDDLGGFGVSIGELICGGEESAWNYLVSFCFLSSFLHIQSFFSLQSLTLTDAKGCGMAGVGEEDCPEVESHGHLVSPDPNFCQNL